MDNTLATNQDSDTPPPTPTPEGDAGSGGTSYLNAQQVDQLLRPLNPLRVHPDNGRGFPHVQGFDIRATLTGIFGFARWSDEVLEQRQLFEEFEKGRNDKTGQPFERWYVGWYALVRLTVYAPDGTRLATYTAGDVAGARDPVRDVAHSHAVRAAGTGGLKKAAQDLGNQFGLGLRNHENRHLVRATLVHPAEQVRIDPELGQLVYNSGLPEPVEEDFAEGVLDVLQSHAEDPAKRLDALRDLWRQALSGGQLDRYLHLHGPGPAQHLRTYLTAHMSAALHMITKTQAEEAGEPPPELAAEEPAMRWDCSCDPDTVLDTGAHAEGCTRGGDA